MRERDVVLVGLIALTLASPMALGTVYGPGPGGPVPDAITSHTVPGVLTSIIVISDQGLIDVLNSVSVTFGSPNHTWVGDLQIILTAPNGDDVHLISRPGSTGPIGFGDSSDMGGPYVFVNSGGANFTTSAGNSTSTQPVLPGTYNRETNPAVGATIGVDNDDYTIFNGDDVRGNWTLTVKDWGQGDTGALMSWSLDINLVPSPGSLALLGVAGLIGAGRRRRR